MYQETISRHPIFGSMGAAIRRIVLDEGANNMPGCPPIAARVPLHLFFPRGGWLRPLSPTDAELHLN